MKRPSTFSSTRMWRVAGLCGIICVPTLAIPADASPTMLSVDANGYSSNLSGINSGGAVSGDYVDGDGFSHGFVRTPDGTITTFDAAITDPPNPYNWDTGTQTVGINTSGEIIGSFSNVSASLSIENEGFLRQSNGTIVLFSVPGSSITTPSSIDNSGAITGTWSDGATHGFIRHVNGKIKTFDVAGSHSTSPYCINAHGDVVGLYTDSSNIYHGFLRTADGTIATIAPPNSVASIATAINAHGEIAGEYTTDGATFHGFVRDAEGGYTSFDPMPGETSVLPTAINFGGEIAGYLTYTTTGAVSVQTRRGFLRRPNGTIRVLDAPPFTAIPNPQYPPVSNLIVKGINNAGVVVGRYDYLIQPPSNFGFGHAFIRTP